ncbi:CBL-interacting serine threonine- kinase 3-like isoform X1 [Olea europaea subsp. europaea]|uniref:CBL-interacting serine threonine- kinase 3-like isoform X1 n=1 Tax=Olea europaea subsp. europaea TaxID=158383 RepID=A0A8S0PG30_OLEEU|nr:CBL-interacting serine threonine- kinase 3-like isoform X1 [Olea europaea subsp. europaea]
MIDTFVQRITILEILKDEKFKKDYKQPVFDEKEDTNLNDVEAVFKDSEEYLVKEKKEQLPGAMNAFELISMSKGLKPYRSKTSSFTVHADVSTDAFPSSPFQWLNASSKREKKETRIGFQNWVK